MKQKIAILTTIEDDWGGSEELWFHSIPYLQNYGYEISVCKPKVNFEHRNFKKLLESGVKITDLIELGTEVINTDENGYDAMFNSRAQKEQARKEILDSDNTELKFAEMGFRGMLFKNDFDLLIISQGINFDGLGFGYICLTDNVPYMIISQKAVEVHWPYHLYRVGMRNVYINARKSFFVSRHNLELTQEQFGTTLINADVIYNPVKLERHVREYPNIEQEYRLICIGRMFLLDKGQDILIKILAQDKWKQRPLNVTFVGEGNDKAALKELKQFYNVSKVEFLDYVQDVETLWLNHQALILPSRFEGSPLVLLEAMACGRTAIVSNAGGNAELVEHGITGFVGEASETGMDLALEEAWARREEWHEMGKSALERLNKLVPDKPEKDFAELIHESFSHTENLVSVIIPTYNRKNILEDAIKSVLAQTYPNIQLIVADDGSEDGTSQMMTKYPQVTYLKLAHGGQAHARNEGFKHARGEYLATLDSDDIWKPDFVKNCLELLTDHNLDFVFANWMQETKENEFVDRLTICDILNDTIANDPTSIYYLLNSAELRQIYLTSCPSPSSSLLIRRASLNSKWSSEYRIADDWSLIMNMVFKKPCKAAFTKEILWTKNVDGNNLFDGRIYSEVLEDLWVHDMTKILSNFRSHFTKEEIKTVKIKLSQIYLTYIRFLLKKDGNKNKTEIFHYILKAINYNNKIGSYIILRFLARIQQRRKREKLNYRS